MFTAATIVICGRIQKIYLPSERYTFLSLSVYDHMENIYSKI